MSSAARISRSSVAQHVSLKALLVTFLFVVAQAAGIYHLISHDAGDHDKSCEICQVAAQLGNAPVPHIFHFTLPAPVAGAVDEVTLPHFFTSVPSSYASRAPPASA